MCRQERELVFTLDELRSVAILAGLPEWQLAWFRDRGTRIDLARGDRMFERGQPAEFMFIVVRGAVQRYAEAEGQWLLVATTRAGQVTGMLPFSRMTHYPGHTLAVESTQVLRIRAADFQEMLTVSHEMGRRLVAEMADRVRGDIRLEQQHEKLMALGKLSAGLAHELNNPAAAMQRTAAALSQQLTEQTALVRDLIRSGASGEAVAAADRLRDLARERGAVDRPPLERSEREDDLAEWLEARGVEDAPRSAAVLSDVGFSVADMDGLAARVRGAPFAPTLRYLASTLAADRMAAEVASAAGRVTELISAVKEYSQMDRSAEHRPTDVRGGLDATLTMFSHTLDRRSVRVVRSYEEGTPDIMANPGELNQVWTSLIDNAIDAMPDGGELRIEVRKDPWCVDVSVIDDGCGIPEEILPRIFDPFFTTKGVGEGTGLGLDIARRIVLTHHGQIDVQSKPGRTELRVRLPISPALPAGGESASP